MSIDSHQHFWNQEILRPSWLSDSQTALNARFEPDRLRRLLSRNKIAGSVAVQADRTDRDTDYLLALADSTPWLGAVVVWMDLTSLRRTRQAIARLAGHPKVRGVREPLSDDQSPGWLVRPETLRSIELIQERGLVLEIAAVFPSQLPEVRTVAEAFPDVTVVIDHLGKPPLGTPAMAHWERDLRATGELPNVCAKLSGLTTILRGSRLSASSFGAAVRVAAEVFGPTRLMVGSDWPVCLLGGSYSRVWRTTRQLVDDAFPTGQQLVMGDTARRIYGMSV